MRGHRNQRAMSLIELMGALAIIAILAAVLLPVLIQETDKAAADLETATLQSYGDALQRSILRNRMIPGDGVSWPSSIAAELGVTVNSVTTNSRSRIVNSTNLFLINGFGGMSLPYIQGNSGTPFPTNPCVMIVSSLGTTKWPKALVSGFYTANNFINLWNWSPPSPLPSDLWSTWSGKPTDIFVQRISLSPLFAHLVLSANTSDWGCGYSIDTNAMSPITSTIGTTNYFIQNSVLGLYYSNSWTSLNLGWTNDSKQTLLRDSSFVFYGNRWRRSIWTNALVALTGNGAIITNGPGQIGKYDFSGLINGFAAANPPTPGGSTAQQTNAVNSLMNYMNAYTNWVNYLNTSTNWANPMNNPYYSNAIVAQYQLSNTLVGLLNSIHTTNTYPNDN